MKNAQSIYYLIGATIVIIVVNTIFFLMQSSRNARNYEASRKTYEIIETTNFLLESIKDAEAGQRAYLLTNDTSYLGPYKEADRGLSTVYLNLYSALTENPAQQNNLLRLNQLIKIKRDELAETIILHNKGQSANALLKVQSTSSQNTMEELGQIIKRITTIEKEKLNKNNRSIEKLTRRTQVFSVISNWVLLVIVISSLISIVQNREKISELFKEVEKKNQILEDQKSELQSLSQDLIKQNHELERFAYVASHDLRSPGVNLIALLQLYEESDEEQEKNNLMDIIKEVADNLIVKLDDLIEMLRSKHESYAVHEQLNFKQVYSQVVKNLSADVKKSNVTLNYDFSEAPSIKYPKSYLESILQNLITNAIKYRSPKRPAQISVKTFTNNGRIFMEVRDNGLGIDLKQHGENIFGIYQTFHSNNNSKGVGLYITKAQVVAMGGTIEVESIPDQGTTFTINFN
ncbi:sensor histidine kinase [Desertivirga arenae]|uniref:sensor histidine kinase n=1 Tax=Desertivirga arenae TaxID=2810309 RepID=UPI001A973212|nr:CHASE3 domain-containing protein [Pedobacter sp. SYSU D00823]